MSNWNFISRKFLKQTDEFPQFPPGAFRMPNQKQIQALKFMMNSARLQIE
jgi:hypothetical protein